MRHLDLQVVDQALAWLRKGRRIWFCTVLATFGSSPREPGSMLVARGDGRHVGSLSGGCVEEDFLARLRDGEFDSGLQTLRYGDPEGPDGPRISLPCGGILDVLIEPMEPDAATLTHLEVMQATLLGRRPLARRVDLASGRLQFAEDGGLGPRVVQDRGARRVTLRIGPAARLILAGISPVAEACAEFARPLGFEVIVCDPREEVRAGFCVEGVEVQSVLPSIFIASGACHAATAVVALTHDPRIDDLAMIEAVRTPAFYIGVMGSQRTSAVRAERLRRSGGLGEEEMARIKMPIGLALGSKTPAEIALAVMADIVRVQRGRSRESL
ncbi:XdhC family protein [Halomonas korlensis]|uniref:Xanthine dehydrogenase accessory factor n=1 Tax=Halomonas korlensis TaxID=463301 RepID=A0A1I7IUN9_9GAMM|nr:XdhC family protein [Halomonas korlensis]SFU76608.1 xanthine dehydrogenase accessory factor [Halomonas korlensis]